MKRNAFTLIEVIVSLTIFTIIITAVYSTFYMGVKVWHRGEGGGNFQKIRIGFLKIERDLKSSFYFSKAPFKGTSVEMVFPSVVTDNDKKNICIITYSVDKAENSSLQQLIRKEKPFSEKIGVDTAEKNRQLISLAESIKFEYAYKKGTSEGFEWQSDWDGLGQNKFPSGVRVSLETANTKEVYNKIIFLQQGKLGVK